MPDLRVKRPRTGVQIWLYPVDIFEMINDPEVLDSFEPDELETLLQSVKSTVERKTHVVAKTE